MTNWQSGMSSIADQWLAEPQPSAAVFTAGPVISEPTFLQRLAKPWVSFGQSMAAGAGRVYEQLPERLFELGMQKLGGSTTRTVQEGAGAKTTYVGPTQPGGAPADPNYIVVPASGQPVVGGIVPAPIAAAGVSMGTMAVIGIVLYLVLRK